MYLFLKKNKPWKVRKIIPCPQRRKPKKVNIWSKWEQARAWPRPLSLLGKVCSFWSLAGLHSVHSIPSCSMLLDTFRFTSSILHLRISPPPPPFPLFPTWLPGKFQLLSQIFLTSRLPSFIFLPIFTLVLTFSPFAAKTNREKSDEFYFLA